MLCSVLFFLFTGFKVTITCYQVNNLAKRPPAFRHVQLILAHVWWGKEGILCRIGTVLSAIRPSIEMATVSSAPSIALTIDTVPESRESLGNLLREQIVSSSPLLVSSARHVSINI